MRITLSDQPESATREAVLQGLVGYNEAMSGPSGWRPLLVTLHGENGPAGGLVGSTSRGWLFVEMLFVPEALRGAGAGSQILRAAEDEARDRGCLGVWLDTFEFQARGFYERLGYSVFGRIDDYPPGFARYFMKKALARKYETLSGG